MIVLLKEQESPESGPLCRFASLFSLRRGIFSTLEFLRRKWPEAAFFFSHPNAEQARSLAEQAGIETADRLEEQGVKPAIQLLSRQELDLFALPEKILDNIEHDLPFWLDANRELLLKKRDRQVHLVGPEAELYIHESASLYPGVVLDSTQGPIVIDAEAQITPFSYLQGPLYAGPQSRLDNVRITGGAILGQAARVGGEIERSLIGDFSNKRHEGFVGDSIIGSWVNLGALTVTSNLKNNYGEVRLAAPAAGQYASIATGRLKFGAIIGDWVRTAIGTMLTTGTVIDAGANVFGGPVPKYVPPLAWGLCGERYRIDRFIHDAEKALSRRGKQLSPLLEKMARRLL